ncbi:MAG: polyamine aminopropyltransferase [Candidatus Omnitrophica bacterium]|nr:polyamine aminopropyltransferase [Candidatus Omnitrophota bacterium]
MSNKIFFDKKRWFQETPFPGVRRCKRDLFYVQKEILRKKTSFQEVFIFSTPGFGKILALDGIIQFSQLDEAIYHETMAHTALLSHPLPKKTLIIGGGDGGVLRETVRHRNLKVIHMVEIDKEIPYLCQKYLGFVAKGAFKDKRVNLFYEDGARFIKENPACYDVIMVDSTDPVGPGKVLFEFPFYKDVYHALRDDGLAIFQAGPFLDLKSIINDSVNSLRRLFRYVCLLRLPMPSYSCGCEYCFILSAKKYDPLKINLKTLNRRYKLRLKDPASLKYYNPSIHLASLVIPSIWQK